MRIVLTGSDGYIGSVAGRQLVDAGHEVHGLDAGYFRHRHLKSWRPLDRYLDVGDIRDVRPAHLSGFDAVVHMGELSNDPLGEVDVETTVRVNEMGSIQLAEVAKEAGVSRFVYMSSCSVYGGLGDEWCTEDTPAEPLTAYARCKLAVEDALRQMACERFVPVALRNATAYGMSSGLRLDLVVNDLCAQALVSGEVVLNTDGAQWRPVVQVADIARAVRVALHAAADDVRGEIFNIGADTENFEIRHVAETVARAASAHLRVSTRAVPDARSYRVSFAKAREVLQFEPEHSLATSVPILLRDLARAKLTAKDMASGRFARLRVLTDLIASGELDHELRRSAC